jgi:DNA-binding LytR/AlgR family response regulator
MNLSHTEEALAAQIGEHAQRFMRIGKRFIVNMEYIYMVDIPKQNLILTDNEHFVYQLPISKDALRNVKELIVKTKI